MTTQDISVNVLTHTSCLVCGANELDLLIDYGKLPLAGSFLTTQGRGSNEVYPLRLARCAKCTLLQVLDIVPPEIIFRTYSYASGTTRTLSDHFAQMGPAIVEAAGAVGKLVVEFGCNDGVLVRPLLAAGAKVVGIDPSDVALQASQQQGWTLIHDYFKETVAIRVKEEYGLARIITGNNVLAHTDDLHGIVRSVTTLLEDEGLFIFEVHYQGDLLNLIQFDTVYHEHVCYYSLASLSHLLGNHGMIIVDVLRIPIHSGSIRVTAARTEAAQEPKPVVLQMTEAEKSWDLDLFVRRVEERRISLRKLVENLRRAGRRVVAYGAAGRATILLNYCGLGQDLIEYVVDMSPLRYGKLVPGVLIPIVREEIFQETPPEYAVMTAWNYEAEIVAKEQMFLTGGGRFVVPLPEVRVVGAV